MRYLSLSEVVELHRRIIEQSGGADGIRDLNALESALAQPQLTFGGVDLYPSLADKTTAYLFSIVMNHAFVDGNKRIGHAAAETFLVLNGFELDAAIDDAERTILELAAGGMTREQLHEWVNDHIVESGGGSP